MLCVQSIVKLRLSIEHIDCKLIMNSYGISLQSDTFHPRHSILPLLSSLAHLHKHQYYRNRSLGRILLLIVLLVQTYTQCRYQSEIYAWRDLHAVRLLAEEYVLAAEDLAVDAGNYCACENEVR